MMMQDADIHNAQANWAQGLIAIGKAYTQGEDYVAIANQHVTALYAYNEPNTHVHFKPTRSQQVPFRPTLESALSYFVGNNPDIPEDGGFALAPWIKIEFNNEGISHLSDCSIAMGSYTFTNAEQVSAEVYYTFAYRQMADGQVKIIAHHSSMPYVAI